LLSGLIKPDAGHIEMRGQIAAMIALGAGFNPILTGRENIYVAGSLRGMTKRQIDAKLEEIIDFSEIGEFIDSPVQSYSSGMQVRLGFSVAVSLKPDVLLIDEVLAVGDASFKLKAFNAISRIIKDAAVIFVSHSITQVTKVCNRALLLDKGRVTAESKQLGEVIDAYFEAVSYGPRRILESPRAILKQVLLFSDNIAVPCVAWSPANSPARSEITIVRHGLPLSLELVMDMSPELRRFEVTVEFRDIELRAVAQCSSINRGGPFENQGPDQTHLKLELPALLLGKGHYFLNLWISEDHSCGIRRGEVLIAYEGILEIQVAAGSVLFGGAPVQFAGNWHVRRGEHRQILDTPISS
jgi:lipopolysaccharide transport system ATP-binding protein